MKRLAIFILLLFSISNLLAACSSNHSSESTKSESKASNNVTERSQEDRAPHEELAVEKPKEITTNRMIIHQAQLQVNVKNLEKTQQKIEQTVNKYGGYIVESNVYRENENHVSGRIIVRIPEKNFQSFLIDAEGEAADILERNVTGQDVTEQYVDLQSRVKSKRVVEARLLEFMSNAQKTEDLLKISADLATIQEEIEMIVGKMNYLENQTAFSTIEIAMYENRVIVPGVDGKDLDTWAKTKKQFATSTNFLLAAGSGLIVLIIGNIPVILIFSLVGVGIYFVIKRKRKNG